MDRERAVGPTHSRLSTERMEVDVVGEIKTFRMT